MSFLGKVAKKSPSAICCRPFFCNLHEKLAKSLEYKYKRRSCPAAQTMTGPSGAAVMILLLLMILPLVCDSHQETNLDALVWICILICCKPY